MSFFFFFLNAQPRNSFASQWLNSLILKSAYEVSKIFCDDGKFNNCRKTLNVRTKMPSTRVELKTPPQNSRCDARSRDTEEPPAAQPPAEAQPQPRWATWAAPPELCQGFPRHGERARPPCAPDGDHGYAGKRGTDQLPGCAQDARRAAVC